MCEKKCALKATLRYLLYIAAAEEKKTSRLGKGYEHTIKFKE